jgi:hypothetical protein
MPRRKWGAKTTVMIVLQGLQGRPVAEILPSIREHYLHSSLGYRTPRQFEVESQRSHSSPFVAA